MLPVLVVVAYFAVLILSLPLLWRQYKEIFRQIVRMYGAGLGQMRRDLARPTIEERIRHLEREVGIK